MIFTIDRWSISLLLFLSSSWINSTVTVQQEIQKKDTSMIRRDALRVEDKYIESWGQIQLSSVLFTLQDNPARLPWKTSLTRMSGKAAWSVTIVFYACYYRCCHSSWYIYTREYLYLSQNAWRSTMNSTRDHGTLRCLALLLNWQDIHIDCRQHGWLNESWIKSRGVKQRSQEDNVTLTWKSSIQNCRLRYILFPPFFAGEAGWRFFSKRYSSRDSLM